MCVRNIAKFINFMYNTMMLREFSATGLLLALTLMPVSVLAYVTPEEALDDTNYTTRFYDVPPPDRELEEIAAEQQRVSAERRAAEQAALKPQPVEEEEPTHEAAPEQGTSSSSTSNTTNLFSDDPATQRLLLRIQAQKDAEARQSFINSLLGEGSDTLHSGAPLADTGPAATLIALAIAGAVGETWRRVRKNEKLRIEN
jgi:hypothetical protein